MLHAPLALLVVVVGAWGGGGRRRLAPRVCADAWARGAVGPSG